jgi:hypothetical protein
MIESREVRLGQDFVLHISITRLLRAMLRDDWRFAALAPDTPEYAERTRPLRGSAITGRSAVFMPTLAEAMAAAKKATDKIVAQRAKKLN